MKKTVITGTIALLTLASSLAFSQQNQANDDRYNDYRPSRMNDDRMRDNERRLNNDRRPRDDYRNDDFRNNNFRQQDSSGPDNRALRQAYEDGLRDGQREAKDRFRDEKRNDYKNVTFGIYAGANSTRFRGEDVNGNDLTGRLGYQAGFFVRAGGRVFGQIGAEYFASSSNFFRAKDGQSLSDISGQIDQKYVQIPVYIGVKLAQSRRGISGVRLQVGAEYANAVSNSNTVQINSSEIKSGSFNALGQLGFDIGPLFIDLTYHHGLDNVINGYNNSARRIASANIGFKF